MVFFEIQYRMESCLYITNTNELTDNQGPCIQESVLFGILSTTFQTYTHSMTLSCKPMREKGRTGMMTYELRFFLIRGMLVSTRKLRKEEARGAVTRREYAQDPYPEGVQPTGYTGVPS